MWIIAGIAAIAALLGWWLLRGDDRRANPETGRGSEAARSGSGTATTREPTRSIPTPRVSPPPRVDAPSQPGGAGDAVAPAVMRALASTGAKATSIDCDPARCEIVVEASDDASLQAALAALEAALPAVAANMIVSAPSPVDGGTRRMKVTAELQ